ncbi:NAD(P)-binding Rossmann-fold containing protein [Glarea lozoyensis ATCC 20868]|uniref:NAD(P)-binding Rossmann-fold containing protein n=1 Tax=Glarea lozoyensis (strain ATCC 20868 / MF5171) TaxID=1116229 RepID=S3E399_GLAL2|nr:NAD(P)-binding Rossmann-fold containing protein [Glarea lozoyensis ATCC 20868]EPE32913.1 NAD(P)-binding Rossmann-fold containing protein [Glarea lozoyensis ATCC 20868]
MTSVTSKVFAITGGASGIGAATCRLLSKRGASVICVGDIVNDHFDELRRDIARINNTTKVSCTVLDVTSSAQIERWISYIVDTYGDLYGAANIAGIAQGADLRTSPTILEETDDEWSKVMKVNLDGVFYCTRAEIRGMKNLERIGRSIVNVGSIAAFLHQPDVYAYGTSKAACAYMSTCAAADAFPFRIRVNTVSPGITNTPLLPSFNPKLNSLDEVKELYAKNGLPLIEPEDVARTIVWLLSDDSWPVYGSHINVGACVP